MQTDSNGPNCPRGRCKDVLLVGHQSGNPSSSEEKSREHLHVDASNREVVALDLVSVTLYSF